MLSPLIGQAVAVMDGCNCNVDLSFDLQRGTCTVLGKAPSGGLDSLGMRLALSTEVFLEGVQVRSPLGTLHASRVGPFFSSYMRSERSEDKHLASSLLAKLLTDQSSTAEVEEILLTPQRSQICLQVEGLSGNRDSEVLFQCDSRKSIDCSIDLGAGKVEIHSFGPSSPLSGYVKCASSDMKLSEHLNELRIGLSLFFRRRSFLHLVRDGNSVTINLAVPDRVLSYGLLVSNTRYAKQVLEKLVTYVRLAQPYFLIEGFSNPAALEVRLLNAFVHLEVIDGGRRLSANQLASVFGITRENADAIVLVRNAMIHDGLNARHALEQARNRIASRDGARKVQARILEQAFQSASPHGEFYGALMDLFSTYLASQAGIPPEWINRRVALSFFEV